MLRVGKMRSSGAREPDPTRPDSSAARDEEVTEASQAIEPETVASSAAVASDEAPVRPRVQRTPMRPAGSVENVQRDVLLGGLVGVLCFSAGLMVVHWTFVRWLTGGGSSTAMAASVLLPVAGPIVIGSILGERGRKAFGYAMIAGVALGSVLGATYFFVRTQRPAGTLSGPLALPR